jgi:osmotically-inducible protein OsmY
MNTSTALATAIVALALIAAYGCAVAPDRETAAASVEDTAISTAIKVRFLDNKDVDASRMRVETLDGSVVLSGFARNAAQRRAAESIARGVSGVKAVTNEIAVRP